MNCFVTENPTVRVWREKSTGVIYKTENNVHPDLRVEFVDVKDGECMAVVDERIEGSMPFQSNPVSPRPRS